MGLPFDLAIPLLGTYPKELKTLIQKNICTSVFTAVLFILAKIWKQPKCPSEDECIKKLWYVYTIEYYVAIKKREILGIEEANEPICITHRHELRWVNDGRRGGYRVEGNKGEKKWDNCNTMINKIY